MKFWPLLLLIACATAFAGQENRLRNGSFEGGTLYWHQIDPAADTLVHDAAVGEFALRIAKGNVMSAPFVAERGQPMTVSFFVKGEKPGRVAVQMPPSAREVGTKAKRLWTGEAEQSAEITTEWKRVSFTWIADVPADGFWPNPHYLVQISGHNQPIIIDGVTVVAGKEGAPAYVPRTEVEVVAECTNLPGWAGAAGNIFEKAATAQVAGHFSNPTDKAIKINAVWELCDYEGDRTLGSKIEKAIVIPPGKTISETAAMKLTATGCVLARVSAVNPESGDAIDYSDLPLTSLPYPQHATKPDFRERFGGSFAGREQMLQKYQRIGFGWTRWFPETKWHFFQREKDAPFDWHDADFDLAARYGVSQHVVLYGWPKGLMDNEHSGQPLPLDMRWSTDDAKWENLTIETAWDKYVKAAAAHFKGKSIVFEIENEPEFDRWDKFKTEYARFTIRTARQIRATDPRAKIMVNNVYGVPSSLNAEFFRLGGLKHIDVISWHDYHEGWLADATTIKRMRQNMDEAGGKNVELWFNEGWAFTNTAVDEPIACTHLTSAQSTNAIMDSVAEMTIAGQEKTILFHTGYEDHGQSFWDYSGPGTLLWDWYGYPLPLVAAWNVMTHHIGLSERVDFVRPPGANLAIFQDLRNGRGVIVAYADREAKEDVVVQLPFTGLVVEDIMGNAMPVFVPPPNALAVGGGHIPTVVLKKSGSPVFIYDGAGQRSGKEFAEMLAQDDRKNAGFVTQSAGSSRWTLPPTWDGKTKGETEGSIASANGKPVWKLEQLWPDDWKQRANFRPMTWTGTDWNVKEGGFGGQPGASLKDGALNFGTRAPHGPDNDRHLRTAGVTFVAQGPGVYALHGSVAAHMWDSGNKTTLHLLKKTAAGVEKIGDVTIPNNSETTLEGQSFTLAAGEELTLLPQIDGMFAGGDCKLKGFSISLGDKPSPLVEFGYKLPAVWEGKTKGSVDGNPITANGQPIWRLDRLYPGDAIIAANYGPLVWGNGQWVAPDHSQGGHPSAQVADGKITMGALGPWGGNDFNYPKIPVLVFIAPKNGVYHILGRASCKPWEGDAKTFPLSLRKKDSQRAAEITAMQLPRDGASIPIDAKVELTAGHELLFVPMMQDLHNNATTLTLEGLTISLTEK